MKGDFIMLLNRGYERRTKELLDGCEKLIFTALGFDGGSDVLRTIGDMDLEQLSGTIKTIQLWNQAKEYSIDIAKSYDEMTDTVKEMQDEIRNIREDNRLLSKQVDDSKEELLRALEKMQKETKKEAK
jgi:methyl-accepting chemotaxis protein